MEDGLTVLIIHVLIGTIGLTFQFLFSQAGHAFIGLIVALNFIVLGHLISRVLYDRLTRRRI